MNDPFSKLNSASAEICQGVIANQESLQVSVSDVAGATLIEFAPDGVGTHNAGIELARICMGGLADVLMTDSDRERIEVTTDSPLAACMGCQYAGWPLALDHYFAMASGPIRMLRGKEKVLEEYNLLQTDEAGVIVLESAKRPDESVVQAIADACQLTPSQLTLCLARTSSRPGSLQVVARSLETAMHKLHEIGFDLSVIRHGHGTAPLPPEGSDDLVALGWTNDSVLYGGEVHLVVETTDDAIATVIEQTPSCSSAEFGRPFLELFNHYDRDFYKIDPMLFSPARIAIENRATGKSFVAGEVRDDILAQSFAGSANESGDDQP